MVIFSYHVILFFVIIIKFLSVGAMINYNIDHKSRHAFIWTATSKCTYIRRVSLARSPSRAKRTIALNYPCRMMYVHRAYMCANHSGGTVVASEYIILCDDYMWERWRLREREREREIDRAYVFLYQHNTKHILPKSLGWYNPFYEGCPITVGSETVCFRTKGPR